MFAALYLYGVEHGMAEQEEKWRRARPEASERLERIEQEWEQDQQRREQAEQPVGAGAG